MRLISQSVGSCVPTSFNTVIVPPYCGVSPAALVGVVVEVIAVTAVVLLVVKLLVPGVETDVVSAVLVVVACVVVVVAVVELAQEVNTKPTTNSKVMLIPKISFFNFPSLHF